MRQTRLKIKNLSPIVRIKEAEYNNELGILGAIQRAKNELIKQMKKEQKTYLEGLVRLNKERNSSDRKMLCTLESGLDFIKDKWNKLYLQVKEIEKQEKAQIAQLTIAYGKFVSFEKLTDKYKTELRHKENKEEQKLLDEISLRNHRPQ